MVNASTSKTDMDLLLRSSKTDHRLDPEPSSGVVSSITPVEIDDEFTEDFGITEVLIKFGSNVTLTIKVYLIENGVQYVLRNVDLAAEQDFNWSVKGREYKASLSNPVTIRIEIGTDPAGGQTYTVKRIYYPTSLKGTN